MKFGEVVKPRGFDFGKGKKKSREVFTRPRLSPNIHDYPLKKLGAHAAPSIYDEGPGASTKRNAAKRNFRKFPQNEGCLKFGQVDIFEVWLKCIYQMLDLVTTELIQFGCPKSR